jgi:hypothetical protein
VQRLACALVEAFADSFNSLALFYTAHHHP